MAAISVRDIPRSAWEAFKTASQAEGLTAEAKIRRWIIQEAQRWEMQGYVVSSRMGEIELPNIGLRFDRLSTMESLIDGLFLTQDAVTVSAGGVTVTGASYQDIREQLDRLLPHNTAFLD